MADERFANLLRQATMDVWGDMPRGIEAVQPPCRAVVGSARSLHASCTTGTAQTAPGEAG
jgi:hypothetical protein